MRLFILTYKLKIVVLLVFLNTNFLCTGQNKVNSYTKLCIQNEKDQILLVKYKGVWELAGKSFDTPRDLNDQVIFMADEMGIEVKKINLGGLFCIYHGTQQNPVIFQYYMAKYKSGSLKVPPGCDDIKWFDPDQAFKIIPFKAMVAILKQITKDKKALWSASIKVNYPASAEQNTIEILENFYKLK
jgi:hypothetical protein